MYGFEAAVEAQIRAAQQRGEFDNLPGSGRPIPGRGEPYDESWWIRGFLQREAVPSDLLLPTPLLLRRRVEQLPDDVRDLPTEQKVRAAVAEVNTEIVAWLRAPHGPQVPVRPVDADEVVRQWRTARATVPGAPAERPPARSAPADQRRRWWSRRRRRHGGGPGHG